MKTRAPDPTPPDRVRLSTLADRVRTAFRDYPFIREIEIVPSTFLQAGGGFENLDRVAALLRLDVVVLVSFDQVQHAGANRWSFLYWTGVGAYLVEGDQYDILTALQREVAAFRERAPRDPSIRLVLPPGYNPGTPPRWARGGGTALSGAGLRSCHRGARIHRAGRRRPGRGCRPRRFHGHRLRPQAGLRVARCRHAAPAAPTSSGAGHHHHLGGLLGHRYRHRRHHRGACRRCRWSCGPARWARRARRPAPRSRGSPRGGCCA